MSEKKRPFTSSLREDLLKDIKKLCIDLDRPFNDLLEESMEDTLKKYQAMGKKERAAKKL